MFWVAEILGLLMTFLNLSSWFFWVCFWIGNNGVLVTKFGSVVESKDGAGTIVARTEGFEFGSMAG